MFELVVRGHFSAAHQLRGYGGKCEALHGHNYKIDIHVTSDKLNEAGIAIDFALLKDSLEGILKELDHKFLNDLPQFTSINPSAENIARFIFDRLLKKFETKGVELKKVGVWESDSCVAYYSR